ncbi:MAG TPA: beta-propeller fold lactonase family protein [Trueperaceae bacterium]|nr:beta-propeller fold lactonase family protein [Trueperaceae bacterium]
MTQAALLALVLPMLLGSCSPGPHSPLQPDGLPSAAAPLALSPDGRTLWVVNPDADSVTALDTTSLRAAEPIHVGSEPWGVAVTPAGAVVVMNRADGSLTLLAGGRRHDVDVGPEPGGLALSPSGRTAYVTLSSSGELAVVDLELREVVARVPVGRMPWALAVSDDGDADDDDERIVITHRVARLRLGGSEASNDGKEGWLTLLTATDRGAGQGREVVLEPFEFGYPNGLEGVGINGDTAFVAHLLASPEYPRDFESTVSAGLSTVSLAASTDPAPASLRLHVNDSSFSTPVNHPVAVAVSPDGATAYLVLAGSDAVMGVDLASEGGPELIGFWPAGSNPRGLVIAADGRRAYVMNYLSRDVSVLDLEDAAVRRELRRVRVAPETLSAVELRGKVLFHNASSAPLSQLGWISCASCHLGGGSDGTTWLTPDGPRQTQPLWNLRGTAPFHASATRDEVQDFERDIEELMAGSGLAPGAFRRELGDPNGGLSADLDALASYVLDGIRVPAAALLDEESLVAEGRSLFAGAGCAGCHGGPHWTMSNLPGPVGDLAPNAEAEVLDALRDVGTVDPTRDVLGANGFDVPTLLGLTATAPYLHDGSAATLEAVVADPEHAGRPFTAAETTALAAFLRTIDDSTATF